MICSIWGYSSYVMMSWYRTHSTNNNNEHNRFTMKEICILKQVREIIFIFISRNFVDVHSEFSKVKLSSILKRCRVFTSFVFMDSYSARKVDCTLFYSISSVLEKVIWCTYNISTLVEYRRTKQINLRISTYNILF